MRVGLRGGRVIEVAEFTRSEFLAERWHYRAGEHVTFLAPTQWGKTTLAYQLLARSATPRLPAVVLVMKPKDPVVREWTRRIGFDRVRTWPPVSLPIKWRRPEGWVLWPKHTYDPARDRAHLEAVFRTALLHSYRRGCRIVFADELYGLAELLNLDEELIYLWSQGAAMDVGVWGATQKPSHVPLWAYSQAEHLFVGNDPDKRARDRYAEIGGVDPDLVRVVSNELAPYHWLYLRRTGRRMCVIGP